MEPAVTRAFVMPTGCLPHLVIDIVHCIPADLSGRAAIPPGEIELSDDNALVLIRKYRLPTADLGMWAF
jgi:hypothetical protein